MAHPGYASGGPGGAQGQALRGDRGPEGLQAGGLRGAGLPHTAKVLHSYLGHQAGAARNQNGDASGRAH